LSNAQGIQEEALDIAGKGEKCVPFPARFGLTVGRITGKQLLTRCPVSLLGRVVILYDEEYFSEERHFPVVGNAQGIQKEAVDIAGKKLLSLLEKGEKCVLFPARFALTVGRIIGKQLLTRCPVSSLGRVVILYDGNVCLAACSGLRGGMSC
ncbi:hypothetical protein CDAR_31871, partial [Caerostris darwini]